MGLLVPEEAIAVARSGPEPELISVQAALL
jgi:hypothetical protein